MNAIPVPVEKIGWGLADWGLEAERMTAADDGADDSRHGEGWSPQKELTMATGFLQWGLPGI